MWHEIFELKILKQDAIQNGRLKGVYYYIL